MNALQRLELLGEHAELVQVIPTLKGMAKLDSLERLSEIVALLGGKVQDEVQNSNDVNPSTYQGKTRQELNEQFGLSEKALDYFQTGYDFVIENLNDGTYYYRNGESWQKIVETEKQRLANAGVAIPTMQELLGDVDYLTKEYWQEKLVSTVSFIEKVRDNISAHRKTYLDLSELGKEMAEQEFALKNPELSFVAMFNYGSELRKIQTDNQNGNDANGGALSQVNSDKPQEIDVSNHRGKTDVETLFKVATSRGGGNRSFANLAKVTDETAKKIKDILGIDVTGFDIGIDESAIRHTLNQHGNEQTEQKRGQTAVTEQDFALVAEITNNADVIKKGDKDNTLQFEKQIGSLYVVVQELRIGQGKLSLKTMYKKGLTSVLVAPDENQSTAETPETVGSLALENNIPQNNDDVNGSALSQAFYDEFMLKNEMGELVFADDEFVDDVDIETHEKALVDGKTYAFGRALIAIDTICQKQQWRVAFNDFNHTLNHDSLFDSLVDDYDVVAQLTKDDKIVRAGVNKDGYIVVYAGTTGNQIINGKAKYDNPKQVGELISLGFETDFDMQTPTEPKNSTDKLKDEPAPQDDESQKPEHFPSNEDSADALSQNEQQNTMSEQENAPNEVEKGDFYEIYQLTQDDIDSERFGKLPSFVGTGEYFAKFYHLKAQGVNSSDFITMTHSRLKGVQDWVVREQQAIQENPFKDKEWENKDGKGKGRIIVLKGGVTKDMVMFGAVYNNEQVTKIGNFAKVNQFIENDDLAQAQRLAQEKAEKEAKQAEIKRQQEEQERLAEQQEEILVGKAELIENEVMPAFEDTVLYDKRGNKFEAVMRLAEQSQNAKQLGFENNKGFIEYLAKQGYEFVKENEYSDDYVPMEYRSKFEHRGGNYGSITSHYFAKLDDMSYEISEAEYHYGWHIRGKINRGEMAMNTTNEPQATEPTTQHPNYTQSDIDYLQSIINGTLDLETVDMDKMIAIGEKDEHDPMYEQALQVVSDYLDKLTSV